MPLLQSSVLGPLLFSTLSNTIRFYYLKTKSNIQYERNIRTQTKYLIWKRSTGAPTQLRRATISYLLRYQMRPCFTTLKPNPAFNIEKIGRKPSTWFGTHLMASLEIFGARPSLSYFLRCEMRSCFTTLKPNPRGNMGENRNANHVIGLEEM